MKGYNKGIELYRTALAEVDAARSGWPATKKLLVSTLNAIASDEHLAMEVQVNDVFTHRESVIATLGRRPSPFQYNPQSAMNQLLNNQESLYKEFGSLIFSQMSNGRIAAWVQFPQCDKFASDHDEGTRVLGIGAAEDWDESRIHRTTGAFFEALAHWELDTQKTDEPAPVGFRVEHTDPGASNAEGNL
jgi:hypothetical protein